MGINKVRDDDWWYGRLSLPARWVVWLIPFGLLVLLSEGPEERLTAVITCGFLWLMVGVGLYRKSEFHRLLLRSRGKASWMSEEEIRQYNEQIVREQKRRQAELSEQARVRGLERRIKDLEKTLEEKQQEVDDLKEEVGDEDVDD